MKKILAIAIVAVLAVALCVSASAKTSLDRLVINADTLTPDDETNLRNAEEVKIEKGDKLYILGWAYNADSNSNLKEVVYMIDGKEVKCADNYRDRTDVANAMGVAAELGTHAGIGKDDGAFELVGVDKLGDGTYTMSIVAVYNDGSKEDLKGDFTLVVGTGVSSGEPAQSSESKAALSLNADDIYALFEGNTGANTVTAEKKDGYVTFTAGGEDPFFAFAQPLNPGADAKYAVIKYRYEGEGDRTIDFYLQIAEPHARAAIETDGEWHYVIIDCSVPFPETMDTLWDGTIARLDPLSGNGITDTSIDIASIEFFASEADAQAAASEGGQQGGNDDNPTTADAAIIAVAAVACLALAGVVVAKKVR